MRLKYDEEDAKELRLPTFRQWVKLGNLIPEAHLIDLVWFPNTYKTYTFQSELFRLNINHDCKLYQHLQEFTTEAFYEDRAIFVVGVTLKGGYELIFHERERCTWRSIGDDMGMALNAMLPPVPNPSDATQGKATTKKKRPSSKNAPESL